MDRRKRIISGAVIGVALLAVAIAVGTGAGIHKRLFARPGAGTAPLGGELIASGFIEAEEIEIAAELGGRVTELPFEEGDEVSAGDKLVQLDTSLLEAQRDAAAARLAIAIAQRDLLKAGAREEAIRQAEAQVAVMQAMVEAADVALTEMKTVAANPQDVAVQVAEAEAQVAAARAQLHAAEVQVVIARRSKEIYEDTGAQIERLQSMYGEDIPVPAFSLDAVLSPQRYEAALTHLADAQAALNSAQNLLAALRGLQSDPQQLQAKVVEAQTVLDTAQAELEGAQAQLDRLRAGPTASDLQAADAQVEEAQAALSAIEMQIERMALYAPTSGVILEQPIHVGELAVPGVPLVTLADLDEVRLTVYITAEQLGRVSLHQHVTISVDSFPERTFEGTVVFISDEAEFTPRNVLTREERVNLVYAVRIAIPNPDHALKPGMPADVRFRQ